MKILNSIKHLFSKQKFIFSLLLPTFLATSCYLPDTQSPSAVTQNEPSYNAGASFYPAEDAPILPPHNPNQVQFFFEQSKHSCVKLGIIQASGNGYAGFDDVVDAAKRKAAQVGADFIVLSENGTVATRCYELDIRKPWANFSVWMYTGTK